MFGVDKMSCLQEKDDALVERTIDPRDDYRAELLGKMERVLSERETIGDKAFEEGRLPTPEEFRAMDMLQARYDAYCEMLCKFFPAAHPEDEVEEEYLLH